MSNTTPDLSSESTVSDISGTLTTELINSQMSFVWDALKELVAFRSVHSVPGLEADNQGAADWCVKQFREAGIPVEPIVTTDGSTAVIGLKEPAEGFPTLLLYSHFDVQPSGVEDEWTANPWTLTERDGRWYARGAADCKGHVVMHLAVLRALQLLIDAGAQDLDKLGIRVVVEGSEERGGYGLEDLLRDQPELFRADTFLIADSGNDSLGVPSVCTALRGNSPVTVTLNTIEQPMHSGQYGGAAPDALLELIKLLGTLHDEHGFVAVEGLDGQETWPGVGPDNATFRKNAGILDGVKAIGEDQGVAANDLTVMRPSITITGLDSLSVADAINAVPGRAAATISLRVPPGMDPQQAQDLLVAHLEKHKPNAQMEIERHSLAKAFSADTSGPALQRFTAAMSEVYGQPTVEVGSGGSIPLTTELLTVYPEAELALYGIEEPLCRIHSADESVDPEEIKRIGAAQLLFMARTAAAATN